MIMEKKKVMAFIPARYASTRLPGKPLVDICGKPLLQWVWEAAVSAEKLDRVVIATDDGRIADLCQLIGAEFVMTPSGLPSGTDRVEYAYELLKSDADIVLNIQGDEPLLTGGVVDNLISSFLKSDCDAGTLVKMTNSAQELKDQAIVKVVFTNDNKAMYFSRTTIPFLRGYDKESWHLRYSFFKHIGIYIFRADALKKFVKLPGSDLEKAEKLEQLRMLQNGMSIKCVEIDYDLHGVDTFEDLEKVRSIIQDREK
jgi:3-deoxy-manno-octulosonate cytidylyltransferase (CMP-KDO synthetase)